MQYKNILGYLEEVQATIQSNPGSIADYDLRQIADLYEIAKKKDYKEARKVESTFAMNARQLKVELGAKMSRTAKSPLWDVRNELSKESHSVPPISSPSPERFSQNQSSTANQNSSLESKADRKDNESFFVKAKKWISFDIPSDEKKSIPESVEESARSICPPIVDRNSNVTPADLRERIDEWEATEAIHSPTCEDATPSEPVNHDLEIEYPSQALSSYPTPMNREWDIDSGEDGNNIEELNSIEMLSGSILAIIKNRHVN